MKKIHDIDINWSDKIHEADNSYNFQKDLTAKLDNQLGDFTQLTLLEIVLWKTNRYPELNPEIIEDINDLRKSYTDEKAKLILRKLILLRGFNLPMASAVLRFACPSQLQIIDQRVYRFITLHSDKFKIPVSADRKIDMYFDYIKNLKHICETHNIPFTRADRILYQLDKTLNSKIPIKY